MEYRGLVVRKPYALRSKSERTALVLVTEDGEYRLKRPGEHPYRQESFRDLEGKRIVCEGFLAGPTLIVRHLEREEDA